MSLDGILDSIAAHLRTQHPEVKSVEVVGGNINVAELLRRSRQLPAVFVFCHGTEDAVVQQNKAKMRGLFAVVLVVRSAVETPPTTQDRARVVARIVGRLLYTITTAKTWSNDEVEGPPTNVDSRNRYAMDADKNGVALWAASWEQMIALTQDPPPDDLDDLETIYAHYELQDGTTPATDAEDEINFP